MRDEIVTLLSDKKSTLSSLPDLGWNLQEIRQDPVVGDASDQILFTGRVRDLARSPFVICPETTTIQAAAQLMSRHWASSVVVVDKAGRAIGIMTDWDLRERAIAVGRDTGQPVSVIMSAPLITLSGNELVYEALRLMIAHNINHLIVTEADRPVGMVTGHDLVVLQGHSVLCLARKIDRQTDLDGLGQGLNQIHQLIPCLLYQGIRAGQLGWLMAGLNDRLVARVLALVEAALGPPPVPYCWLLLGSEGRREQTFKTDQDNALIYADPAPEIAQLTRTYFMEFGRQVVAALVEIGFPPCASHCTADNPDWVQSLSGWRGLFGRWITAWDLEEVFQTLIFFDFRGIYGDLRLAEQLRHITMDLLAQNPRFLSRLAHLAMSQTPPLGFFGRFTLETHGEHKEELDLKLRGTMPIVEVARFFALRHGITETNTLARLEHLKVAGHLPTEWVEGLAQAFEFMLSLRLRQQWEQLQAGQPLSNYINPKHLSNWERSLLREAFKAITPIQERLRAEYHVRVGRFYS